jgi:hypothetical protein
MHNLRCLINNPMTNQHYNERQQIEHQIHPNFSIMPPPDAQFVGVLNMGIRENNFSLQRHTHRK